MAADFLTTNELAERLGVKPVTIRRWRQEGTGPTAHRFSNRLTRYRLEDVEAWERAHEGQ